MKKLLIVPAVILTMLFGQIANATVEYTLAFSDVDQDTSYMTAISWMQGNGVIQGYPDGTFKPDQCVNRAEFLKMMFLTLETNIVVEDGFAGSNYYDDFFSDTSTDQWYWPYVEQALRDEAIEGYPDGTFKPAQCVNRVEALKMATLGYLIFNEEAGGDRSEDVYRDALPGNNWFDPYLYSAVDRNAVGKDHVTIDAEETYFYPGESMSRKEVAEMLYRMKTLTDNDVFGYVESMSPQNLNYYISPSSGVSFLMPEDWVVTYDGYYTTAGDVVADYPTIYFAGPEENEEDQDVTVSINQRMMNCSGDLYAAICHELNDNYTIGAYDPDIYASELMNMIMLTFREPVADGIINDPSHYYNQEYNLSFDIPEGWSLTNEEVMDAVSHTKLMLTLKNDDMPEVSVWISAPPVERGLEGSIIEDGFERNIEGLTLQQALLMRDEGGGTALTALNMYYIEESDWVSHIEFDYSAPDGDTFDGHLQDYYHILDSVEYSNTGEVAFDGCGAIGDYSQESWFSDLVGTWDQAVLDEEIVGIPVLHDPFDSVFGEGCLALDDSLFIFIPAYMIDGGGKLFSYDTTSGALTQADSEESYAVNEFGTREGSYVNVYGVNEYYGCQYTEGHYYYLEDRFEKIDETCSLET
ncbi:S-layer homology domain-containing protein [Patescibacteria group bacterium]